jgi:hypothetical protein
LAVTAIEFSKWAASDPSIVRAVHPSASVRVSCSIPFDPARSIRVSGSATINVVPDRVQIDLGIQSNDTTAEGVQAKNLQVSQGVIASIQALGVEQNFLVAARALDLRPDAFAPPLQLGAREVKLWLARGLAQHPCQQRLTDALKSLRDDGSITRRMLSAAPSR